jgi:peptide/nickel transport system permease protein
MTEKVGTIELPELALHKKSLSPFQRRVRSILGNRMAMLGIGIIIFWAIVAIFAKQISPFTPIEQAIGKRLNPPSAENFFGTDELGRDIFSRVVYGARLSLPVGLVVIVFAMIVGSFLGATAGYLGGVYDLVVMRLVDITLSFPSIVLALAIATVLGPSLMNAVIAMILVWWPAFARLMRGQVLSVKHDEYVTAAQVVGASNSRILFRHILPNCFAPILVKASLDAGNVILTIAALSFIGLGAVPPTPEWGAMVSAGRYKFYDWWMTTFPGLAIMTVVLGFNVVGDGVRDAFDPHMI